MSDKIKYVSNIQNKTNQIALLGSDLRAIFEVYFDRGYNSGGADPITDGDLTEMELTANDVASFITLAEQFGNFLNNGAVFESDYAATVNKLRTDI